MHGESIVGTNENGRIRIGCNDIPSSSIIGYYRSLVLFINKTSVARGDLLIVWPSLIFVFSCIKYQKDHC